MRESRTGWKRKRKEKRRQPQKSTPSCSRCGGRIGYVLQMEPENREFLEYLEEWKRLWKNWRTGNGNKNGLFSGRLPEEIKIKKRRAAQNKELRRKRT